MAYMAMIIRASQDHKAIAWVRYDVGFWRQAALTKNRTWSQINSTLYSMCFTASFQRVARCELCLGTTHSAANYALQGEPMGEVKERMRTMEATLLALAARQQPRRGAEAFVQRLEQVCRLYNQERCHYVQCKHIHECLQCHGSHQAVRCQQGQPSEQMLEGRSHQPMKR